MATFVTTTLTRRTGATTTVFNPSVIDGGTGFLMASGSLAGFGSALALRSYRSSNARKTMASVMVPQLDADGLSILSRPTAKLEIFIPDGTLQADVNDLVGYINALTATGLTNANDIFVNGVGVF